MPQPRRTPWINSAELSLVFEALFHAEGSVSSQEFAIARIKVWLSRGSCPHAVESTACLLEIVLRDTSPSSSSAKASQQELRLAYSMAIIRFVNSLVDPLQTTYFARSMATLAAQLGLPLWFIEVRHAATHEDLPRLPVLRDAARQALDWLYSNYWLQAIHPPSENQLPDLEPLRVLLASYKNLVKTTIRDASKISKHKGDLLKVYRGIESWVQGIEKFGNGGRERALDGLAEACLQVGGLVPTAKKKRPTTRAPALPTELASIWTPLLLRMEDAYAGFQDLLLARMVEILSVTVEPGADPISSLDRSYIATISAWIIHFLQIAEDPIVTETVVKNCLLASSTNTLALLDFLSKADPLLASTVKPLLHVLRNSDAGLSIAIDDDSASKKLEQMEQRLRDFEMQMTGATKKALPKPTAAATGETGNGSWKLASNWKSCPIGSLPGEKFPSLDLL